MGRCRVVDAAAGIRIAACIKFSLADLVGVPVNTVKEDV